LAVLSLTACSTLGYHGHLAHGEYSMLAARRPIERVVADPAVDDALKARLRLAEQARAFASERLALPRNASYTQYADLHRPYATWNVFAAAEFSVDAVQQCYLIVGCLAYRGYFDHEHAEAEASRLRASGLETWIGGSVAYSTLGWFDDPILNTILRWDEDELEAAIPTKRERTNSTASCSVRANACARCMHRRCRPTRCARENARSSNGCGPTTHGCVTSSGKARAATMTGSTARSTMPSCCRSACITAG
jgi:hypothetical protein